MNVLLFNKNRIIPKASFFRSMAGGVPSGATEGSSMGPGRAPSFFSLLKQPEKIMLDSSFTIHSDITQQWYFADHIEHKHALLAAILNEVEHNQAIVFCATREDTVKLKDLLNEANLDAIALSGDLLQNQRAHVMSSFISGQHSVLVTTDVASRGLDMKKVSLVVNFDLPKCNRYCNTNYNR